MGKEKNVHAVMTGRKTMMSPTRFRQIVRKDYKLSQLLEDYPEHPEQYIRTFMLQVNGKRRKIVTYQSDGFGNDLRKIHRMLAYAVRGIYTSSENSFAYKEDLDALSALGKHLSSGIFLKTDIHAYFDSVEQETMLECLFRQRPTLQKQQAFWTKALATCFYESHLPIGFVSSPILSDLYLNDLDRQFSGMEDVQYTRYADDIIFSTNAEDAEEKLGKVRDDLVAYLAGIHLELNRKKTYIRTLKQEGDAIHLLGLNLVRTAEGHNRITVSDRYIRKVSMELCDLIREKNQIEEWEREERFSQVNGKIGYIRHASSGSAEKLRKMIRIKTGEDVDLTYQSLRNLILPGDACYQNRKTGLPDNYVPDTSYWYIPDSGCIREEVHIPAEAEKRTINALRYYLNNLCTAVKTGISDIRINNALLAIGEDTKELKTAQDIQDFKEHVFRLRKSREAITYSAEYSYDNGKALWVFGKKRADSDSHLPAFTVPNLPAKGFIYDKGRNTWNIFNAVGGNVERQRNQEDPTALKDGTIPAIPEWRGEFRMELRWPRATGEQPEKQIRELCSSITGIPGIKEELVDFPGKHVICTSEKRMTGTALQTLVNLLQELDKVVCEVNGRNKMQGWFVPASCYDSNENTVFMKLTLSCRVTSRMEIRLFRFDQ